jgi:hypothetical protein
MANEWANKDKYHPSNGVPEPNMQFPWEKAIVCTVLAWGGRRVSGGVAGRATPVRLVRVIGVDTLQRHTRFISSTTVLESLLVCYTVTEKSASARILM